MGIRIRPTAWVATLLSLSACHSDPKLAPLGSAYQAIQKSNLKTFSKSFISGTDTAAYWATPEGMGILKDKLGTALPQFDPPLELGNYKNQEGTVLFSENLVVINNKRQNDGEHPTRPILATLLCVTYPILHMGEILPNFDTWEVFIPDGKYNEMGDGKCKIEFLQPM